MIRQTNEKKYSISRTRDYGVGVGMGFHLHNSTEIIIGEEGIAKYSLLGREYLVGKNDILVISPMEIHQFEIVKEPFIRYGFTVNPIYYRSLNLDNDLGQVFLTPTLEQYEKNYRKMSSDTVKNFVSLLEELKTEEIKGEFFSSHMERFLVSQLTILLFRSFKMSKSDTRVSNMNERMQEIQEYINLNFHEKLDLESLSRLFFLHPSTISKEFKKSFGTTLVKYINTVRICEATRLLENTKYSVSLISDMCGYEQVNTFLRQFKSIMETTPLQYRNSMLKFYENGSAKK